MGRAARRAGAAAAGASGARWSLFAALADGMEDLVRRLAGRLPPRAVRLGERVIEVARTDAGWRAIRASGASVIADAVVIAVESHQAQRMLRAADPSLSHLLGDIAYASSAIVTLGYRRADVAHPLGGFGFVVPHAERRPLIACSFSSVKFPGRAPDGHVLVRVFMGGALQAGALDVDDDDLQVTAREQLAELLGARGEPAFIRVVRHPRSMPQYQVGHLARVEAIELGLRRHPGLALAGAGYRGVGIPDCIRSGEAAAERLLEEPVIPAARVPVPAP
jgi:oxygen-dependent protoporphyrinogen oxidase